MYTWYRRCLIDHLLKLKLFFFVNLTWRRWTLPYIIGHSMETSTELHEPLWRPPRSSMEHHEPPRSSMEHHEPPWRPPRSSMEPPRSSMDLYGGLYGPPWSFHGPPWRPPRTSTEPPRTSTEASTEPPRTFMEASTELYILLLCRDIFK